MRSNPWYHRGQNIFDSDTINMSTLRRAFHQKGIETAVIIAHPKEHRDPAAPEKCLYLLYYHKDLSLSCVFMTLIPHIL